MAQRYPVVVHWQDGEEVRFEDEGAHMVKVGKCRHGDMGLEMFGETFFGCPHCLSVPVVVVGEGRCSQ